MGKQLAEITPVLQEFIEKQNIFFVGTAGASGRVNLSPKGMDSLKVLSPNRVIWLNVTGSGNESAAHVLENGRMTLMFCALEGPPLILRLYGTAQVFHPRDPQWAALLEHFPTLPGTRQIFLLEVDLVQTSCGMAVPFMDYREERTVLNEHNAKRSLEQIQDYWERKNTLSLDGKPTGIFED